MTETLEQAKAEFPILRDMDLHYKENFKPNSGFLEFWPADEPGTPEQPRPSEIPFGKIGVEVYDPRTRPIDIMGDVASHHLNETDEVVASTYDQFKNSLTPEQIDRLQQQYAYAQQHEAERRPFNAWAEHSGIPGYFRGYAFNQWENARSAYTPEQITMFDKMMQYLRTDHKKKAADQQEFEAGFNQK